MPQKNNNPYASNPNVSMADNRGFVSMDLFTNSQDLKGDYVREAANIINVSGQFAVRPGLRGMYGGVTPSSSSGSPASSSSSAYVDTGGTYYSIPTGPLYGLCKLTDSIGLTWMIIVDGNGKLYKTLQGSASYTELLDTSKASFNFDAPNTYGVAFNDYAYIIDGNATRRIVRVSLTGGFPAYPMQRPTTAPTVALTSTLLYQANTSSDWSFDGQATATNTNLLSTYGQINGGQAAGSPQWAGLPTSGTSIAGPWYNMISPGSGFYPVSSASSPEAQPGVKISIPALSGNAALYPSRFHVTVPCIKDTHAGAASFNCVIYPFDASGNSLSGPFVTNIVPTTTATLADFIVDMSTLGPNVAKVQIAFLNALAVSGGNMFVSTPQLYAITTQLTLTSGVTYTLVTPSISGGAIASSSSSSSSSSSYSSSLAGPAGSYTASDLGSTLDLQGTSLTYTFGATQNLSTVDRLVIGIGNGQISSWVGASFNLYVKNSGSWILADNGVTISTDLTGLDCDISTLTQANRSSVTAIKLTFQLNVDWVAPFYSLPLGPITEPGNLTLGLADYQYYVAEKAIINPTNSIIGNPSIASSPVTPIFATAEVSVIIPSVCPVNTSAPANVPISQLWYVIGRRGGAWSDVRVVAVVPANADVAYGADSTNPYYSWDHTAKRFLDNTPDEWLELADLVSFSRDPMPAGAQAIGVFQSRMVIMVGNIAYVSWLFTGDNSAPLMTTVVLNLSDPDLPISGASFPVMAETSDKGVAMIAYGTPVEAGNAFGGGMLVFSQRTGCYLIQGTNSSNFSTQQYPYGPGIGLVATRGIARVRPDEIIWMGPDRLHIFPPAEDSAASDIGLRIQPKLYPVSPQTLQDQTAFSKCWMNYHDARLYIGAPEPGETANSIVWIYDTRVDGWTRFTGPTSPSSSSSSLSTASSSSGGPTYNLHGMAMTGAMTLPPNGSGATFEMYYFGISGQLFRTIGTYDQYSPISYAQAIPFVITVHGMRPAFYNHYGQAVPVYYNFARLERGEIEMQMTGQLTIQATAYRTGTATPIPIPGKRYTRTYNLVGGGRTFRWAPPGGLIEGQYIEVSISGAVGLGGSDDVAYCRGIRGALSGTTYEQA